MKRTTVVLAVFLAHPVALAAQTNVDQKRTAAPDAKVSIENFTGSVKVTGWPKAEVAVKGTLGAGAELSMDGTDEAIGIEIEVEGIPMGVTSDIEVFVPTASRVSIESFQATISVTGVTGTVSAETVNGSITQSGAAEDVQLQSVNGPVEATGPSGRVHLEAVNGPVTVRDASGTLEASTVNGKLIVAAGSFDRVALESVAGVISFQGTLAAKGTLSAETVSGDVELAFPAGFGADFAVSTFSGSITNELGPTAEKKSGWVPGTELRFTSGSGGAQISVETLSGAVKLRKK
jgi:DUF4097 and DUF4098 domain-containing protein YvlB